MPFGNNPVELVTDSRSIASAQTLHLSPEKNLAGTVASKGVDRNNARHQGAIYHPLMIIVAVDTADGDTVTLSIDHGDGAAFNWQIATQVFSDAPAQLVVFDLEGDFPGLLIYPKGSRLAPDSLTIAIPAEASTIASTSILFEILGS